MTQFEALLSKLNEGQVQFVVVGGVAATIHGSARLTTDLDIVYSRSPENLARLVAALEDFQPYLRGAPPGLPFQWDRRTLENGLNFTLTTKLGDLDLLGVMAGAGDYEQIAEHSESLELFGQRVKVVDLPVLIAAKRAAGRPKDLEVIAELEALQEELS